jgi:hypothetical protein
MAVTEQGAEELRQWPAAHQPTLNNEKSVEYTLLGTMVLKAFNAILKAQRC